MSKTVNIQDVIDLLLMNREEEYKKSLSAEYKHKSVIRSKHDAHVAFCDYLIECVKQLSSVQSQWIPCSERLPDRNKYVLVTDNGETDIGRRFDGRWVDCYGDKLKDVTAWMPLPEPYKEEEE